MESPSQVQKSASLLETEYCQSPSGQAVAYVLKESQNLGNTGAVASPKIASPYASKKVSFGRNFFLIFRYLLKCNS